ncbi:type VII secretion target [Mycobacterium talmoniae]|uniref:Uncharacterized protein n=1 Tax=Mycobacterium talmoniae TaxID=1858794 RepID=A0A1S1NG22_9MYCO|nr:type VII secretion target [Mycobacterium talmoniae]OHV00135.1 hypothetical protein BKN37_18435 [Mycobacterium talmoniae]
MADSLTVNPAELISTAAQHEQRVAGWRAIGATPPNDPDALTPELSFVGYPVIESLRVDNARRLSDTDRFADEHTYLAESLRGAAQEYLQTDEDGATGVTGAGMDTAGASGGAAAATPVGFVTGTTEPHAIDPFDFSDYTPTEPIPVIRPSWSPFDQAH